ncbi:glycoside hydrolase family 9 protein [Prevotella heparinolytica]|nr:glycoside hydrolase family 9 protein [Bacteroides heparinolyticus]
MEGKRGKQLFRKFAVCRMPVPGFLVGEPNPGRQDGVSYPSNLPDESYADVEGSYASNEIAINWSAALVALASSLDALMAK